MTYDETIAYLYGLEASLGWDLKLDRVRAALERLGSPQRCYPCALIAGTNGKGSTAAVAHAILGAAGRRVGLYTSPHLVHFTERIRVGDREIERDRVIDGVAHIRRVTEPAGIALTFFEMATVLALLEFAVAGVDAAVLEVGLGGRLDATNAVDPAASAVVSIGFDHEAFLGSRLAEIAREKAGVMRRDRTTVLGPALPTEARQALLDEAGRSGARVHEVSGDDLRLALLDRLTLAGEHMRGNAAVALALLAALGREHPGLRVEPAAVGAGLGGVRWPGRLEVVQRAPLVLLDGAHNREGAAALVRALPGILGGRRVRLLFGALADKHWHDLAVLLAPLATSVVVTRVGGARGVAPEDLRTAFPKELAVEVEPEPARALHRMIEADRETPVLVAGSLYLVGAVYAALLEERGRRSVFDPQEELAA